MTKTLPQQPKIESNDEILEGWGGKELATDHGASIWRHRVSDLRQLIEQARAAGFREGVEKAAEKAEEHLCWSIEDKYGCGRDCAKEIRSLPDE